jgi:pyruvate dehydrogenase E1 component alpha subunit
LEIDPIIFLKNVLIEELMITEEEFKEIDKNTRQEMVEAMKFAEESPWPEISTLEKDVFAP